MVCILLPIVVLRSIVSLLHVRSTSPARNRQREPRLLPLLLALLYVIVPFSFFASISTRTWVRRGISLQYEISVHPSTFFVVLRVFMECLIDVVTLLLSFGRCKLSFFSRDFQPLYLFIANRALIFQTIVVRSIPSRRLQEGFERRDCCSQCILIQLRLDISIAQQGTSSHSPGYVLLVPRETSTQTPLHQPV